MKILTYGHIHVHVAKVKLVVFISFIHVQYTYSAVLYNTFVFVLKRVTKIKLTIINCGQTSAKLYL